MMNTSDHFIELMRADFRKSKQLAEKAMSQVSDEQLFAVSGYEMNSIAVVVRHMAGNMISRWTDFYLSDGEKPDRNRDHEFEDEKMSRSELMEVWEKGWKVFLTVLDEMKAEDLVRTVYIRQEAHSVMLAVIRQHSHYNYHIGQIVLHARMLKGTEFKSLSIPRGESLNYKPEKK